MRYPCAALLACCLLLFTTSATAMAANANSDSEATTLRVQLKWKHQFQFAGYYAALNKGFYADEGLDVTLLEGGPDKEPIASLLAGNVEYAVGDAGAVLSRAKGKPLVVLASIFQHSPQVIYTLGDILNLEQLRGKAVMMQEGNLTIEVRAMLEQAGLHPYDYRRVPIGNITDLIEQRVSAFPGYSTNEGFYLRHRGIAYRMFRPTDYDFDFYGDVLLTSEQEIAKHPERASAFRRATIRGWEYALAHKQEIIRLIKSTYDSQHKSPDHLTFEANAIDKLMMNEIVPIGYSNLERWRNIATAFEQLGMPAKGIEWSRFIYRPAPRLSDYIWQYRYTIAVGTLALLLIMLYFYTVQLRSGIRRRTAELARVSTEYRDILDHMQDAYYRADSDGTLRWVSEACERQLGYSRDKVIGMQLADIYYQPEGRERFLKALQASGGNLQHYEVCLRHKDGSPLWAEVNAQFYFDSDGNIAGIEGNVRNINERKRAEQEHRELSDQLQQAQKMESIGILAGGIAHDFNNLLVGVMGNAELAQLDNHQPELQAPLEQIVKSASHGADLVRQMLAYSGQGHIAMGEQQVNSLIRDVSELLTSAIGKQIELKLELEEPLPLIFGDKNQLTQMIMNLMTNAAEAIEQGPGEIILRTGRSYLQKRDFADMYMATEAEAGNYVFIEVCDNGCGMDLETRQRIFDPFFTTKESGSGLGLSALLGIVRSHGGTLKITSAPDEGACFTIHFPMLRAAEAESLESQTIRTVAAPSLTGAVLVVDDEESVRMVARQMLEREGIRVLTANNGQQAVETFRDFNRDIALVVMDLTMPQMDGEQAFHAIRAIRPEIQVVLSSGFSEAEAAERLFRYGLAGFIRKPYTRRTLLGEIARLGLSAGATE